MIDLKTRTVCKHMRATCIVQKIALLLRYSTEGKHQQMIISFHCFIRFHSLGNEIVPLLRSFYFTLELRYFRSRDSVVGVATGYGLDDRGVGVRLPVGSRIFSSPCRPDRLWGSPNLLSNGYRRLIPGGKAAKA
jgi:hypothetical protein